ncbi:MAG TPA: hypothetical protein VNR87_04010 [Flavisolibacter sp.]|nr:hypothetical protein [Flavisolibacter sp.]
MNTFLSASVLVQNTLAEYEIFQRRDRYKALLILDEAHPDLPLEFTFWKENGQWKSLQMIDEHVLYQFGYIIDNHLLSSRIAELKNFAA